MYKIRFDERVIRKDRKRFTEKNWIKILRKIKSSLKDNPFLNAKALKGNLKGLFRLRAGDYRIIFTITQEQKSVTILKIGHRSEIYKKIQKD